MLLPVPTPACFFSLGFEPVKDDFEHDFNWMTDEADGSGRAVVCTFYLP